MADEGEAVPDREAEASQPSGSPTSASPTQPLPAGQPLPATQPLSATQPLPTTQAGSAAEAAPLWPTSLEGIDPDSVYIPIFALPPTTQTQPPVDEASSPAQPLPAASGGWGPPATPPVQAAASPSGAPHRRLWPIVLVCAVISALVGGLAGLGGNQLAGLLPPLSPVSSPSVSPSPSTSASGSLPPAPPQADAVEIAKKVLPSLVLITVRTGNGGELGSGFVIDAQNGYVLTNNHVVAAAAEGGRMTVTLNDGTQSQARIVGRSPSYDVAVIQLQQRDSLVPVDLGDSDAAQVGAPVVALGAPLGLQRTVTAGILSAKGRAIAVGLKSDGSNASSPDVSWIDALQTDASINPGNSGGPLVDAAGRVIGIDTAAANLGGTADNPTGSIGLGFAIPINQAHEIAELLIANGKVSYPTVGLGLSDDDEYSLGVQVSSVSSSGAAAKAGLREGDVITKVGDVEVFEPVQLIVQTRTYRPGDQVVFTYERGGQTEQATVTLGGKVG